MKEKIIAIIKDWRTAAFACLALGLIPYYPEPDIIGKIKWITSGADGMDFQAWLFFLLRALPLVYLLYILNKRF